ncbi:MAG: phosphoribosylformylglycinamidine cyclo-ligase, partial [Gammaproteobacteria bacterium]|nr:phosphoribosylformylglycinamidine cyclo-ligase [Gammaproteobacteria bacterium]
DADLAMETLTQAGEKVWRLGRIEQSSGSPEVVVASGTAA